MGDYTRFVDALKGSSDNGHRLHYRSFKRRGRRVVKVRETDQKIYFNGKNRIVAYEERGRKNVRTDVTDIRRLLQLSPYDAIAAVTGYGLEAIDYI